MEDKLISTEEEVSTFLTELKKIIEAPKFNKFKDFDLLLKKKSEEQLDIYTTQNTILELNYNIDDVINEILKLKKNDYIETCIDRKNSNLPKLFVFNKNIQGKDVYIKVKIRSIEKHKIFCISFHFAKYKVKYFPYK